MTNCIEKMMKKYKVKSYSIAELGSTYNPKHFEMDGKLYPKFTPEKQLGVIKIVVKLGALLIAPTAYNMYQFTSIGVGCFSNEDFTQALAAYLVKLHKHLTPTQRQEIKEVLEG